MRIIDLYNLSEEERKKKLQEQNDYALERRKESEELSNQATQKFNDLVQKMGSYNTNNHYTTYGNLEKAYKNSNSYRNVKNSLDTIYKQNNVSLWDRVQSFANDLSNTGKNLWSGGKVGAKQTVNYTENATANNFNDYNNMKRNLFYSSPKVNEFAKATAKTEDSILKNKISTNVPSISEVLKNKNTQFEQNIDNEINKYQGADGKIETNLTKKAINESINKDNIEIQKNIENTKNDVMKKINELAPSVGQMGVGAVASAVNPALGTAYFTTSSGGSYIDDAKQRGMSDKQAFTYGTIMGAVEGATEQIGIGNFQKAGKAVKTLVGGGTKETLKEVSKEGIKEALKRYGIGIADNVMQEAIIEPIQELTAQTIGGKDKANWDNMGQRMLQSGFNGGLVGAIVGGADVGVNSCVGLVEKINNGQQITQQEFETAVKDASKELDVGQMIIDSTQQQVNKLTQNEQNTPTQQITQQENKIAQNGNMERANNNQQRIDEIVKNKPSFSEQVDQYVANKYPSGDFLYLGKTPNVLTQLGAPNNQIILKQKKLKSLIKQSTDDTSKLHGIPVETIKRLPESIANPLNVLKSSTGENSIVIITDLADTKERPIIASIELDYDGQIGKIDFLSNRLTSAYGKNNYDKFMQTEIAKGNLLYDIDEGIIKELPATRLQSPKGISSFDETSSFINNSVPQNTNNVNNTITNNYAQNNENNTPGETVNWNEIERPEGKIRKHYKSIIESSNTSAEAKAIAREVMETDTYVPDSRKKQLQRADVRIQNSTPDSELNSLMSRAKSAGKIDATDIAVGERLIQYYSKIGDKTKLRDAIHTTAMAGTTAGQTVQAMSLLNHQTPEGQAIWIERSVEKLNNKMKQQKGEKAQQFDFTPEMQEKIINSKNKAELEQNLEEVYKELGQQVHKSFGQQIDSWRYFSMLGNPRTHIRNIVGNFFMGKAQGVKNKIAGTIEGTVAKFNSEMERTHTLKPASKEILEFAKNDIKNVASELELNNSKYRPQSRIENNMRTFKSDAMENTLGRLFSLNDKALEAEDGWGLKAGYKKALAEYMTANKLTPSNMTDIQLSKARKYAVQQAKEATFHQANVIASAVNSFFAKNKFTKAIGDSVVPFVKTPANVAKAGFDYSPAGFMKNILYDSVQLRKGNITVNQYIDNISKGLTGSGITVLGFALAQAGILKASGSDDDKKKKFDEQSGKQAYSMQIGDNTYTIDWLAPAGIPLMVGAEIYEGLSQKSKEKSIKSSDDKETINQFLDRAEVLANSLSNTLDPMVEMSMISGLTSTIKSFAQGDTEAIGNMLTNGAKSYVNQFVPTLLGQVAKTTDTVERDTTTTKNGNLPKQVDSTLNQMKSKIPGLRQTLPTKKDIWGNETKLADEWYQRFFEAGILPTTKKSINNDKVVTSLNELYNKSGSSKILPTTIEKKYTIDGQDYRMTNEEYNKYKTNYGRTSYNLIKNLVNSKTYKELTDTQKEKAIENIYSYAKEKIKIDFAKSNKVEVDPSTLVKTIDELKDNGSAGLIYMSKIPEGGNIKDKDKIQILLDSDFSDKQKSVIYENMIKKQSKEDSLDTYKVIKSSNMNINEYLKYKQQSFASDKEDDGTLNGKSVDKKNAGSAQNKFTSYINSMNITGEQRLLLYSMQGYKTTTSQKKQLVNYVQSLDLDKDTKLKLYNKFSGFTAYKNGTVKY